LGSLVFQASADSRPLLACSGPDAIMPQQDVTPIRQE